MSKISPKKLCWLQSSSFKAKLSTQLLNPFHWTKHFLRKLFLSLFRAFGNFIVLLQLDLVWEKFKLQTETKIQTLHQTRSLPQSTYNSLEKEVPITAQKNEVFH